MNDNDFLKEKAKEWLKKGDSDIRAVRILIKDEDPPTDTVCFHCQQAIEKYLKGFLTLKGIEFKKSHDLYYLLKLCKDYNIEFEKYKDTINILNKYSIEPRYPADIPVYYSLDETKNAIALAEEMIKFIIKKS